MSDYINRDDVIEKLEFHIPIDLLEDIKDIPPADVVPVVRCKDCKWWVSSFKGCEANPCVEARKPKDFCSCGERKDDETI